MNKFLKTILVITLGAIITSAQARLPVAVDGEELPTLAPMIEKVSPSVVNIATTSIVIERSPLFNDPFFRRFLDIPQRQRERKRTGLGSGVVIDAKEGHIITNNHVIESADDIVVTLSDGRKLDAVVIGRDEGADIAVIQVEADNLIEIKIADSEKLRVGDFVVAIGNPFGLAQTVTSGIVSALGRSKLGIESYEDFIQTDASINPGNSGGALVNLRGELVGINTAIVGPSGGSVGIGFAIPINMAQQITAQLIEHGEVKRGRLGFTAQDLTQELAEAFDIDQSNGVVIASVEEDSAAAKAGLKVGDVIVAFNGQQVEDSADVRNMIGLLRVGTEIEMDIVRNGEALQLYAKITERKSKRINSAEISDQLAGAEFILTEIENRNGSVDKVIIVSKLEPGSPAVHAGLRNEDIIHSINKQPVVDFDQMQEALKDPRGLLLNIQRGQRGLFLLIR